MRQERDTGVSSGEVPGLGFSQLIQLLTQLYRIRPHELGKLTARVKKVQRSGVPMGTNVGKGPRARYSLEHLFQLIVVLELAELSISLPAAADLVKTYWPDSGVSLAPAHAWLMHQEGDEDSLLLLATASEREGLSAHSDEKEAATARAGAFMVGARSRPMDGLRATTLSAIMTGSKLNLSRPTLSSTVWRSSVIDCSVLVPTVVQILVDAQLLSEEQFTSWAKRHCELFIAEAETRLQTL